jgi:RHS repeat-associated protein
MSRAPLGPIAGALPGLPPPGKKRPPRPPVQLSLEMYETRWVPQDLVSIIRPASTAVGFSLFDYAVLGHRDDLQSDPPAPAPNGAGDASSWGQLTSDVAANADTLASFSLTAAPQQSVQESTPATPAASQDQSPSPTTPQDDWIDKVGAFLNSTAAPPAPTPAEPPNNSGGGEGLGSVGAGLNTSQPPAPLATSNRNVPDASSVAGMLLSSAAGSRPSVAAPAGANTSSGRGALGPTSGSQATTTQASPVQNNGATTTGFSSNFGQVPLEFELNVGQSGDPALAYDSGQVTQKPIVQLQLNSPNNVSLPGTISASLTINGSAAGSNSFSTTGFSAGDTLTLALQSMMMITTTGGYSWSVNVTAGTYTNTFSGFAFVVAQDSSPLGAGWTFAWVNQLVNISASGSVPAGQLMVFGTGGWRFYQGTTTFTSPAGDNGTLTLSGGTYTYSTPDGQSWTYNSSGLMTQWNSPDGQETLQYRYDGSSRLTGITAIDGALTTISYSSGQVTFQTVNNRVTTLTLDLNGNTTNITNPDGGLQTLTYDLSHHLTSQQLGLRSDNWAYNSVGVLATITQGSTPPGITNPDHTEFYPALTQGLSSLVAGIVEGKSINPMGATAWAQFDGQGRPLAMSAGDNGVVTLTYSNGFVTSETDPLGRTTTYSLDSADYVTQETMPDGAVNTYQYQAAYHALTTMTDERNNTTTFAYDSAGHVTGATDALGAHTTYGYLTNGLLQTVKDANNHTVTYSYDSDRRLQSYTDATRATVTLGYDANGNLNTVNTPIDGVTTLVNDVLGRVLNTVNPQGGTATYTWDVSGLALTSTDELGLKTSLVYDSLNRGLLVETVVGAGSTIPVTALRSYNAAEQLIATRDENGWTTTNTYDQTGKLVNTIDPLGDTVQFDYDLAGQQTAIRDAMGNWIQAGYNLRGWLTQVQDALGNIGTLAYDPAGNLTATTDPLGHTFTFTYDAANQQTVAQDPLGHLVTTSYDPVGNIGTVVNARGVTTSFAYDANNQLTSETHAVGTTIQRAVTAGYNTAGNLTTLTDALSHVSTVAYDTLDQPTNLTDPLAHTGTFTYDAAGDVTTSVDALSHTTTYSLDVLHRTVGATDPLSHTGTVVLDGAGETAVTIDPLGNVNVAIIDPLGRTIGNVDALGNVTLSALDPNGNVRMVTDPDGNETHYLRDRLGRVTQTNTPLRTECDVYDAAGRVTQITDADGRVIQYSYDAGDRLTGEVWKNASGVTVNVVTYSYDNNDNLLTAADYNGTLTYTYDALDRVQSYTNVFGQTLTYAYDANDNVTQRTDSLGGTLTYVYDTANRPTSEQFSGTGPTGTMVRVDFGYDAANRQTTIAWFSNLAGTATVAYSAYSYDNADRLTGIVNKDGTNTTLSYYNYSYDNADRVSAQTHWSQVGTTVYSGTNTYTYDATNQLVSDGTTTYSYDANGNRNMAGYTTASGNEMTNDGTWTYTYDSAGNTISKTSGSGGSQITWTYSYDNANELTGAVEVQGGVTITQLTYTYDVSGERVQEQLWQTGSGTSTTRFAYDGMNVWAQLDGSNNIQDRFFDGPGVDQVVARVVASGGNAGAWAYFTDAQGSVRDLVNWIGQVQDTISYSGYGVPTESNALAGSIFGYDGYQYEASAGLNYANARWYNPSTGTWVTEDPIGFSSGQTNFHEAVNNNPTNETDATGLLGLATPPELPPLTGLKGNMLPGLPNGFGLGGGNMGRGSNQGMGMATPPNPPYVPGMPTPPGGWGPDIPVIQPGWGRRGGALDQWMDKNIWTPWSNGTNGGWQDFVPILGSFKDATQNFANGNYIRGTLYFGLTVLDAVGVATLAKTAYRGARGAFNGARILASSSGRQAAINGIKSFIGRVGRSLSGQGQCTIWQRVTSFFTETCFAAGTLLLTPEGSKPIEEFQVGDLLMSRNENDQRGAVEAKMVEEVFVRTAPILHLHVAGKVIRTTAEHPFWVVGVGWMPAGLLRPGNLLSSHDGQLVAVDEVFDTGHVETVYNLRVADFHTYFVGSPEWGFWVWAHNAIYNLNNNSAISLFGVYEIYVKGILYKIGKADLGRITLSTGLPTRLHQQLRWLIKKYGANEVSFDLTKLGTTTTKWSKTVEANVLKWIWDTQRTVPPGNIKSFVP